MHLSNIKVTSSKPRTQSIGDYKITDIDLNEKTALAHFYNGGVCRIGIEKLIQHITQKVTDKTVLYIRNNV